MNDDSDSGDEQEPQEDPPSYDLGRFLHANRFVLNTRVIRNGFPVKEVQIRLDGNTQPKFLVECILKAKSMVGLQKTKIVKFQTFAAMILNFESPTGGSQYRLFLPSNNTAFPEPNRLYDAKKILPP